MSITYRFSIDGVIISEPENLVGWDKLVTSAERDSSKLKGLLVTQESTLGFRNDLYRFFKNKYFNDGICSETNIIIEQSFDGGVNYSLLHEGIIKTRDIILKDMLSGDATAKVEDNSYYARIQNNQSVKTNPEGGSSKNGEPVTVPAQFAVTVFRPADGVILGTRQMFKLFDVMRYLVRWMSDGEVEFESDLLETDLQLAIQRGDVLRTGLQPVPFWEVSFEDIYKNLKGLRDIGYIIEYDVNGKPILRLELASYFFLNTNATDTNGAIIKFTNPTKVETSVKGTELYSVLRLGSDVIADYAYLSYPVSTRYEGFKKEDLYILGQCNIDQTLDLTKNFITSTNAIEDALVGTVTDEDYDDEIFLIHIENINDIALTADAVGTNPFGATPPIYYNMILRNSTTAKTYYGVFQGNLVAGFLNVISNAFVGFLNTTIQRADNSVPPIGNALPGAPLIISPIIYQAETDLNNNFNPATGIYTCPLTGWYTFNINYYFTVEGLYGTGQNFLEVGLGFNNGPPDNLFATFTDANQGGIHTGVISGTVFATAGQLVSTYLTLGLGGGFTQPVHQIFKLYGAPASNLVTKFSCTAAPDTGGEVQTYDPGDVRNVLIKFDYPLKPQDFNTILQNLRGKYTLQCDVINETFEGWIELIKYNHKEENANIILKTSVNTIDLITSGNKLPAYQFIFDMVTAGDQIDSFTYDTGLSNVAMSVELAQSILDIKTQILAAFGGAGIGVTDIVISRISLGGARFNYKIIIVNPNFTMDIIDVSGNSTISSFFYY